MASTSSTTSRPRDFGSHRSFTLPAKLSDVNTSSRNVKTGDADIETLFESPKCKIVSFSPAIPSGRLRTASLDAANLDTQPIGELPCGSNTEHTIALGPLRVYRVPGSVAFLNSGKLVHPVLPKSACWCVDGKTKFVLGVPGKKYYRIELPCEDEKDQASADDFKLALAKISQYETTACPFKRDFHVELPEVNAVTTKRLWKPKHAPGVISPWSPEGQQLADGVRAERLFPSPRRRKSQSPRRYNRLVSENADPSDSESALESGTESIADPVHLDQKVPKLVATYDELGISFEQDHIPDNSRIVQDVDEDDLPTEASHITREDFQTDKQLSNHQSEDYIPMNESPDGAMSEENNIQNLDLDTHPNEDSPKHPQPVETPAKTPPPKLQTESESRGMDWLEFEDNDETPIATRSFSGIPIGAVPNHLSLAVDSDVVNTEHMQRLRHGSEAHSLASVESSSSFHSFHSPTSPVLYSPIGGTNSTSSENITQSPKIHKRETSSNTVTIASMEQAQIDMSTPTWPIFISPNAENGMDDDIEAGTESDTKSFITATSPTSSQSPLQSPTLSDRQPRSKSPSSSLRVRLRRRRTHSPLPPSANIYIPPASLSGHLTNIILNKTANLLLGPPVQLVALMLNLARRFADGKLKGETFTYGDRGQPIPCEWCDSDLDVDGNSSEEDDYGISIGGTPEKRHRKGTVHRRKAKKDDRWALD